MQKLAKFKLRSKNKSFYLSLDMIFCGILVSDQTKQRKINLVSCKSFLPVYLEITRSLKIFLFMAAYSLWN